MKKQLLSFHGKQGVKDVKMVALKQHKELDNMLQKTYFNSDLKKGCAVTCTMYTPEEFATGYVNTSGIHGRYETELGIPRIIAALEDRIFEGLPVENSKDWPLNFIEAIPVGVDLENVWRRFMIWLLTDNTEGVIKYAKNEDSRKAIQNIADAFERSLATEVTSTEWWELRKTARSYAAAAAAAAAYAAAAAAAAADAAYADAAAAVAYADAAAAVAADAAAAVAAYAVAADAAAAVAAYAVAADAAAARQRAMDKASNRRYILMSEKLIELLKAA